MEGYLGKYHFLLFVRINKTTEVYALVTSSSPFLHHHNVVYRIVNLPNLAHQHWQNKKTEKCPNNFGRDFV